MKKFIIRISVAIVFCATLIAGFAAKEQLWHHEAIGLAKAKQILGEPKYAVKVAIIDNGVDFNFEPIKGKVVYFYDAFNDDECASKNHDNHNHNSGNGHATNVATVIAGSDGYGILENAQIMSLIANDERNIDTAYTIAKCIYKALLNGADIINISLGNYELSGDSKILVEAINNAHKMGVAVICAAGNEAIDDSNAPAGFFYSISVGAEDKNGKLSYYSNYGWDMDITAPGDDIIISDGKVEYGITGTSAASPIVTGALAYFKSIDKNLKIADLEDLLFGSADKSAIKSDADVKKYGYGSLDMGKMAENYAKEKNNKTQALKSCKKQSNSLFATTPEKIKFDISFNREITEEDLIKIKLLNSQGYSIAQTEWVKKSEWFDKLNSTNSEKVFNLTFDMDDSGKMGVVEFTFDYTNMISSIMSNITNELTLEFILSNGDNTESLKENFNVKPIITDAAIYQNVFKYGIEEEMNIGFNLEQQINQYIGRGENKVPYGTRATIQLYDLDKGKTYIIYKRNITAKKPLEKGLHQFNFKFGGKEDIIPEGIYLASIIIETAYQSKWEENAFSLAEIVIANVEIKKDTPISISSSKGGEIKLSTLVQYSSNGNELLYAFEPIAEKGYKCVDFKINGKSVKLANGRYKISEKAGKLDVYAQFEKVVNKNEKNN